MKTILLMLALAGAVTACNNRENNGQDQDMDTLSIGVDTERRDTTSLREVAGDVDSTANAIADSARSKGGRAWDKTKDAVREGVRDVKKEVRDLNNKNE